MKKAFLIGLVICCFFQAGAQENSHKKTKMYQTWIRLNNDSQRVKGILYEIGDSSLFVAGLNDLSTVQEYSFRDVDLIKVRRQRSIIRGAIAGAEVGIGGGLLVGSTLVEEYG
ncbi:MAG TPA: hypothetical protein VGK10_09200, partial [Prolixibacteraceae bacterium]